MTSLFKHIFLFLIAAIILYLIFLFFLIKSTYKSRPIIHITNSYYSWKGGDTYQKFKEYNKYLKYDVVILGSSRAYRGYSPFILEKMGYEAFNLGTSAQSVKNSFITAKHFLTKSNCQLLIFDLYPAAFLSSDLESSSNLIMNLSSAEAAYEIALNTRDFRVLNMLALRYFTESNPPYYIDSEYAGKGFSIHKAERSVDLQLSESITNKSKVDYLSLDQTQIEYFEKLARFTFENGIQMICVYSPCTKESDIKAYKEFLMKTIKIMQKYNVKYYNYSRMVELDDYKHFFDLSHLNQSGVEYFNHKLFSTLRREGVLK